MAWKNNLGIPRLWLLGLLLLAACGPAVTPSPAASVTAPTVQSSVFDSLAGVETRVAEIAAAPEGEAQAQADALWQSLVDSRRAPLVFGQQVVFFYKGFASRVQWRGTFNGWEAPGVEAQPIGQTDLWMGQVALPSASRAEYKVVLNGQDWRLDAANPLSVPSSEPEGNSLVVMPGFVVSDEGQKRAEVAAGMVTADLSIASQHLGYPVGYWVYTPPGYASLERLPVLYLLDGNNFVDERLGALPTVLDNLIAAGRIPPLLAVFVDAREPGRPDHNRRDDEFIGRPVEHARFIAEELVPAIDAAYRTDPRPEARVIAGVSFGGLSAYYIGASEAAVFHNVASFSPSLWVVDSVTYLPYPQLIGGALQMVAPIQALTDCGASTSRACPPLPLKLFISAGLPTWDVGDLSSRVDGLRQAGYPVQFDEVQEGHTWSHWRGQTDEMLIFFFGGQ